MAKDLVMRIIMTANDKASAAFNRMKQAASGLNETLLKTKKQIQDNNKVLANIDSYHKFKQSQYEAAKESDRLTREIKELNQAIAQSGRPTKEQISTMQKLEIASQKAAKREQELADKSQRLSRELKLAGVNTQNLTHEQARLIAQNGKLTAQLDKQTQAVHRLNQARAQLSKAGERTMKMAAVNQSLQPIMMRAGTAAQHGLTAAMSEEDAMQGIIRQVDSLKHDNGSLNHAEIAKMRQEIQALSETLPMSTIEIMNMYAAGAKMNVPRQELANYVSEAVKAANAFDAADAGQLAEELGRIRANFKLSKEAASELVNVMNYLDDNALVSGSQLISYMNEVSGSMGLAKMGEKHIAALGSALISAGTESSTAAKAVGSLMTRLATAPDMKPVREAIEAIGLDAKAVQKGMVTDAQGTLEKIIAAVKKMPKEQQAGILKGLAGGEYNRVFAQLISNTELWQEQIRLATSADALGSLDREFAVRVEAMSSKWQMFKNKAFNAESGLGRAFFGIFDTGLDYFGKLLNQINAWLAQNPKLAATLAKVATVLLIVLGGITAVATAIAAFLVPLAAVKFAWLALSLSLGGGVGIFTRLLGAVKMFGSGIVWLGRMMLLNPIGIALTLLATAAYLLYTRWHDVVAGFNTLCRQLGNAVLVAANLIMQKWNSVKTGTVAAIDSMIAKIRAFSPVALFQMAFNVVLTYIRGLAGQMMAAGAAMIDGLINGIKSRLGAVQSHLSQLRNTVSNFRLPSISGAISSVKSAVGFSRGGYTGHGGVNQIAGTVHKGEVVFSQRDVARFGGWQMVERLRRGGMAALSHLRNMDGLNVGQLSVRAMEKLGDFFSGSLKNDSHVLPRPISFMPPRMASVGASFGGDTITIHIHAAPNHDTRSIADMVLQKLQQRDQAKRRRANSSFMDKD